MYKSLKEETILRTFPFDVQEMHLKLGDRTLDEPYYRISCPNWVNILPITAEGQAVLIKQPRAGAMQMVLETPGGMMEKDERDPTLTATRELEEETGFTSQRVMPLASINPNPAIQDNILHCFVGLSCAPPEQRQHFPDANESIQICLTPVKELEQMVRTGQINHALSALTIMLALKYLDKWL